jgi:hypothetical protein
VPPHVAHHYLSLSAEALVADVVRHYRRNVWPLIVDIVRGNTSERLILEGSAILPELTVTLEANQPAAIWLIASEALLTQRIHASSQYVTRTPRGRAMIDKFVRRTCRFNERIIHAIHQLGVLSLAVDAFSDEHELADGCLAVLQQASLI